ncbi:hypothetical protein IRT38_04865 [Acinetobacter sp. SK-43]|uniref:hypothetical protein n=1 Tax=Acinetobacter TaxID=469 RepID=UPI001889E370|nr:hypothetical protein [Acinetobacter sp. SK-43]MBF4454730.1 hypothetical protein [Acinetobacter sp. SK-43]
MIKQNILHTLTLSFLMMTPPVYAETTKEMIARLAESGRKSNKWTSAADCKAEQEVVRQFRYPGTSRGCEDGTGRDTEQSISAALDHPWAYRYGGKVKGEVKSSSELKQQALEFLNEADKEENKHLKQTFTYRPANQCDAALHRLTACAYQVAAARRDGITPVTPEVAKAKLVTQCAPAALEKANRGLQQIDQRIADYLNSPSGKQITQPTPHLQIVMWGTSEQAKIMKQHCPDADAFKQEIADRMASYESALRACRQIQSNPNICGPVAPP